MDHVKMRRLSLCLAAVTFSGFFALLLGVSAYTSIKNDSYRYVQAMVTARESIVLPVRIAGTPLTVERIASYDGPFYEDGSGREVQNVSAIQIKNTGSKMISQAKVSVMTSSGYHEYELYMVPPFSSVLVPECTGKSYAGTEVYTVEGSVLGYTGLPNHAIEIRESANSNLQVRNLSASCIMQVNIYYKTYLLDADIYIGGVPFVAEINCLSPYDAVTVLPLCYAAGYSKILYVE